MRWSTVRRIGEALSSGGLSEVFERKVDYDASDEYGRSRDALGRVSAACREVGREVESDSDSG